jgi:putative lipoprotein
MKIRNVTLCLVILLWLNGCVYITPSYEVFAGNMETRMRNWTPTEYMINNVRQIYDEHRYIYVYEDDPSSPKGCTYGILTNRDDKPEKAVGWIILSGKENCKQTSSFVLLQ